MDKLDLILQELKNLNDKFDKLEKENKAEHEKLFSEIHRIEKENQAEHEKIFSEIHRIDRRITGLKEDNREEHYKILQLLECINASFIKYETEGTDKIKILFDADEDNKNHRNIYSHEFIRLNDLIAKQGYRISNLENKD